MPGKGIVDGVAFPSNFQSKHFGNKLFEKSRSSTTVTAWAMLWQLGFCLGSQWQKMKAFLFHADMGQMYNISFSFHPLLFQGEIFTNTEVLEQKKIFFHSSQINEINLESRICVCIHCYVYELIYSSVPMYIYMFFVKD